MRLCRNSFIREKLIAFLRVLLIRLVPRHLPHIRGKAFGSHIQRPPLCKGGMKGGLSRGINAKKDGAFCAVPFGCLGDYSIVMLCVSGSFGCSAFGNSRVRTPFSYLHLIDSGRMSPT